MRCDHTLILKPDEFTTITIAYHATTMAWDEFADDAIDMLHNYAHDDRLLEFMRVETKHIRD
jgi:hypothetical protein